MKYSGIRTENLESTLVLQKKQLHTEKSDVTQTWHN